MSVGNTLLILTTQANADAAAKLAKRKQVCADVRSTASWSKDQEEQLRQAVHKANIAHACFKIL